MHIRWDYRKTEAVLKQLIQLSNKLQSSKLQTTDRLSQIFKIARCDLMANLICLNYV